MRHPYQKQDSLTPDADPTQCKIFAISCIFIKAEAKQTPYK